MREWENNHNNESTAHSGWMNGEIITWSDASSYLNITPCKVWLKLKLKWTFDCLLIQTFSSSEEKLHSIHCVFSYTKSNHGYLLLSAAENIKMLIDSDLVITDDHKFIFNLNNGDAFAPLAPFLRCLWFPDYPRLCSSYKIKKIKRLRFKVVVAPTSKDKLERMKT